MNELSTNSFKLSYKDYVWPGLLVYYRTFVTFPTALWQVFNILFLPFTISSGQIFEGDYRRFAWLVAAFALFWTVGIPLLWLGMLWRNLKNTINSTSPRIATLNDRHLIFKGEDFESIMQWASFRRAGETKRTIYLHSKAGNVFVVLKSAFTSAADVKPFLQAAQRHIKNAAHKQVAAFYDEQITPPAHESEDSHQSSAFQLNFFNFAIFQIQVLYGLLLNPLYVILIASIGPIIDMLNGVPVDWIGILDLGWKVYLGLCLFVPGLLTVITWLIARRMLLGDRWVRLTPESIYAHYPKQDVTLSWRDIRKVRQHLGLVLFWTSGRAAILVPFSAFKDKAQATAFHDYAVAYWKAARATK